MKVYAEGGVPKRLSEVEQRVANNMRASNRSDKEIAKTIRGGRARTRQNNQAQTRQG